MVEGANDGGRPVIGYQKTPEGRRWLAVVWTLARPVG
jgi:DNA-binding PadR family transcriptional regulator